MKTILGTEIPESTRGIVYLCHFNFLTDPYKLTVIREILCDDAWRAMELYANIPNPPSQVVTGKTYQILCDRLAVLHENLADQRWVDDLANCI